MTKSKKISYASDDNYQKEDFYCKTKSKILLMLKKKTFFSLKIPNFTLIVRGTLVIVEGILILLTCFGTQTCRIPKEKFYFDKA